MSDTLTEDQVRGMLHANEEVRTSVADLAQELRTKREFIIAKALMISAGRQSVIAQPESKERMLNGPLKQLEQELDDMLLDFADRCMESLITAAGVVADRVAADADA